MSEAGEAGQNRDETRAGPTGLAPSRGAGNGPRAGRGLTPRECTRSLSQTRKVLCVGSAPRPGFSSYMTHWCHLKLRPLSPARMTVESSCSLLPPQAKRWHEWRKNKGASLSFLFLVQVTADWGRSLPSGAERAGVALGGTQRRDGLGALARFRQSRAISWLEFPEERGFGEPPQRLKAHTLPRTTRGTAQHCPASASPLGRSPGQG